MKKLILAGVLATGLLAFVPALAAAAPAPAPSAATTPAAPAPATPGTSPMMRQHAPQFGSRSMAIRSFGRAPHRADGWGWGMLASIITLLLVWACLILLIWVLVEQLKKHYRNHSPKTN